jgi:RimJ/RimL family protein N-acetyltransferase
MAHSRGMRTDERFPGPLWWPDEPLSDGVVTLDRPVEEDVPAIVAACNDAETRRWLALPFPYTPDDGYAWVREHQQEAEKGETLDFAIRLAGQAKLVGSIGAHFARCRAGECEIGYWVTPAMRCQGVARRAITLLADHVFATWRPRRIEMLVNPDNVASCRAAEAAGASFEGIRARGIGHRNGTTADAAVYVLLSPS